MEKKIISFEVSAEVKEALRVAAFHEGISVSAYVRQLLEREVLHKSEWRDE
jgi:predicted HicB family RNase H-like nuclease